MWDYPFFTASHNTKNHKEINRLYENVKTELNNIIDNPITVNMYTDGALKPVEKTSPEHAQLIKQKMQNNLIETVKKMPQVGFANYGDFKPNIHGQADFLDHYFTSLCPEWALEHMADGRSTLTQVNTLKNQYPSLYLNFVNNSLINLIKDAGEYNPKNRTALYAYMGIETHPNVSYGAIYKNLQTMQQGQPTTQQSEQPSQLRKLSISDSKRASQYAKPFTSPEGRLP